MIRLLLLSCLVAAGLWAQPSPPVRQFLLRVEPVRADFSLANATPEERPVLMAHAGYLKQLLADGKLVLAGQAFPSNQIFGIIIVEAADLDAARAILEGDPAFKGKVFRGEVFPFRTVFQRQPAVAHSN